MKFVLKGLLLLLVAAGALVAHSWYLKPLSINIFFERVFIQAALDMPQLLSGLRIFEQFGVQGHNQKLDDASSAKELELQQAVKDNLATLRSYDRASLSAGQQLSYDVLEWYLQDQVDGQAWYRHDYPLNQMGGEQAGLPSFMVTTHQVNNAEEARWYITRLSQFGRKFGQLMEGLREREAKGVLPPRFVIDKVLTEMRGFVSAKPAEHVLVSSLKTKLDKAGGIPEAEQQALLADAQAQVEQTVYPAYAQLIAYYEGLQAKVTENYGVWKLPQGDAYYDYQVRHHTTTKLSAEEVHQIGLAEVARIEAEMDAILRAQGMSEGSVGARVAALGEDPRFLYPDTEEAKLQILKDYQAIIDEISKGLDPYFDVRPKSSVEVRRVPEFREQGSAGAYYEPPAMDGSRPGVFYSNLRSVKEIQKFGMRTLSYHEAVPGHHFQIAIAQELQGVPTFRKLLPFTAYVEGWALYSERLAKELGYLKDPFDDLGRLQAEMFRAVRLVVDTGLHRKRWTREQAIAYMLDKTGMAQTDVVAEIERYLVIPGQALAYKTGMLKIQELRERAQQKLGPKFDVRQFHNIVLKNGAMPLGILERVVDEWIAASQ